MKNLGIYVSKNIENDHLLLIKDFFNYDDLVVFSSAPQLVDDPNIGVLGPYYITFFDGVLIFTNKEDLHHNIKTIKTNEVFLLLDNTIVSIDKKEMINELR